jgi:DNA-binding GntR family transcriptional regulator
MAIVEQEISDTIKVSRTPIREALKQLEAEGLVNSIPGRGTFVQALSNQDIEEIFELRELFELKALEYAVNDITDKEIEKIEKILFSLEIDTNHEEYFSSDRYLHNLIVKYSRNRRMINFLNTINAQLEWLRRVSSMTPRRLEKSKQEHIEILQAIKERDLEKSSNCLSAHLQNIKASIKVELWKQG